MGTVWFPISLFCLTVIATVAKNDFDAGNFLEKFGYLDDLAPGQSGHSEGSTKQAIREFQRFNGLRATGRLDSRTIKKMKQPRCGLPDVIKPSQRAKSSSTGRRGRQGRRPSRNQPSSYYAPGYKWEQKNLKYKVVRFTSQLPQQNQLISFKNALQKWTWHVPLNFEKVTSGTAEMDISFGRREHGDGAGNSFDGRGRTLAHAFFPGNQPIAGDTHFDDDEQWTLRSEQGSNLEIVAAHEFGHALGMGHSNVRDALMAPYYQGYDPDYRLHQDDITGIQSLYGRGRGSVFDRDIDGTIATSRPRVTSRPTTTPAPRGRYCRVRFDATAQDPYGYVYAFRGENVLVMNNQGVVTRQKTQARFPNAPSSPGAAVYDRYRRHLFIFKGNRYWRYTWSRLDSGYPRPLPADFAKPRAAFQWRDGGIYLFLEGNRYIRWAEGLTRASYNAPARPVQSYFRGAPTNIEAALQARDGYYYFFKGQRYWKFSSGAQLQRGYPKDTRPAWLSCGTRQPR